MAHEVALDETLKVEGPEVVEAALLQRLEEHQLEVDAFLQDLSLLRAAAAVGGTSLTQLQNLLRTAATLQAKLGATEISKPVVAALEKVGIPVEQLQKAKLVLVASSRFEEMLNSEAEADDQFVVALLGSWEQLRRADALCKEEKFESVFGQLDLDVARKREEVQLRCQARLLKVAPTEEAELRDLMRKNGLEVKSQPGVEGTPGSPLKRNAERPTRSLAAEAAVARSRSPTPPPGMRPVNSPQRGQLSPPKRGKAEQMEAEVTFSGSGLSSFIESQKQALLNERAAEKVLEEEPSLVTFGKGLPAPKNAYPEAPRPAVSAPSNGIPELWRAVHVGDDVAVARLIHQGLCNGAQRDASGHSVLWHAIAFGHLGLARMMLERFPPGIQDGVDVTEVHLRKGETLLHLLCQCRPFTAETAGIFKDLAEAMPVQLFTKVNMAGQSFLAFAAATQNFWVLRHLSLRYPEQMKVLICSKEAPLRFLVQKLPAPAAPSCSSPERIPEHFAVSALLSPDASGRVPFADVAFDVLAEESFSRFLAHRVVVASQSSVFLQELSQAPLQDLPEGIRGCVVKVDRRISKEVWRTVLQFLYTGVVQCPFAKDPSKMVELLRACCLYKLPKSLLDLAQQALFQQLPTAPRASHLALEIFSITCGSSGEGLEVKSLRDMSMLMLLGGASEVFAEMAPEKLSAILDKLIVVAEQSIFRPSAVT